MERGEARYSQGKLAPVHAFAALLPFPSLLDSTIIKKYKPKMIVAILFILLILIYGVLAWTRELLDGTRKN